MKVYRIIEYDGEEEWINKQLDMSIHGTKEINKGKITVATISSEDHESIDIVRNWLQDTQAVIRKMNKNEVGFV